jgi:hypothetical protein
MAVVAAVNRQIWEPLTNARTIKNQKAELPEHAHDLGLVTIDASSTPHAFSPFVSYLAIIRPHQPVAV